MWFTRVHFDTKCQLHQYNSRLLLTECTLMLRNCWLELKSNCVAWNLPPFNIASIDSQLTLDVDMSGPVSEPQLQSVNFNKRQNVRWWYMYYISVVGCARWAYLWTSQAKLNSYVAYSVECVMQLSTGWTNHNSIAVRHQCCHYCVALLYRNSSNL